MPSVKASSVDEKYIGLLIDKNLKNLVDEDEGVAILEISKDVDEKCMGWLLDLLRSPVSEGGRELEVHKLVENKKVCWLYGLMPL